MDSKNHEFHVKLFKREGTAINSKTNLGHFLNSDNLTRLFSHNQRVNFYSCMIGVRKTSVAEAEEKLEALKRSQVKKKDVIPPAKYLPLTFIPDMIIKEIQNDNLKSIPCQIHSEAVLLIADVCGKCYFLIFLHWDFKYYISVL